MKLLLLRFGELYLKGNNQKLFKRALLSNIKTALKGEEYALETSQARYVIKTDEKHLASITQKLKFVFGLVSFSVADEIVGLRQEIEQFAKTIKIKTNTFRVTVNRANKSFPISSVDFEKVLGGIILQNNPQVKVDLHNPQTHVKVDIRENLKNYVYLDEIQGAGGLPLGTAGKGLVLLSGGIDSPVSAYQIAKRGLYVEALHFHSYPYTSEQAKEKVLSLAKQMKCFMPKLKVHFISITKLQEEITKNCNSNYMITLMRRFMFRVAEEIAIKRNLHAIVTGENLGQVASQTLESLTSTNSVLKGIIPLRPLISFDKNEIIKVAQKIGTYDISILPYEDCCTVFLPKNPVIKPKMREVLYQESKLNLDELLSESLSSLETIEIE